ncbi:UNVERIFIED_CONTAM: hypothetical protein FKN15_059274 [Acipenser sinensis]
MGCRSDALVLRDTGGNDGQAYRQLLPTNSPATFPDIQSTFQTPLFHPTPIHPKVQAGPEVRIYDPVTGKLIRKGSQSSRQSPYIQLPASSVTLPVHGDQSSFRVVQPHQHLGEEELQCSSQDDEQPGPSRRERQPSMSESMPLYTLCKEDLESMDKERFFLSNIRRIRPFLTNYATQLLVQALVLSRLDYCNSLLAGLPASATRPLQLIQNSAARLVFSLPRFAHATPLLRSLHWLPITARIQFKTLVLAYRCLDQTAPSYLQTLISPYTPTRPLRSACTRRLALPPLRSPASRARSFSTLAPQWWNDLPTDVRTAQSLTTFRRLLKTHLFRQHL